MIKSLTSLALLALLPSALAHGSLATLTVDGKAYTGPTPGQKMDSVVRMITSINPVTDLTSSDMSCGNGAAGNTATQHAAAKPGSKITFDMRSGNVGATWPHDVGPIMTYMASCGGNDCSNFDSLKAQWFKVGEAGYQNPDTTIAGGDWVMADTYYKTLPYGMTLPSNIPSGAYLLRMESIALHRAQASGGAELYPSCSQLLVSGGSGSLPTTDLATFPGTYKATDPGILIDVYTPTSAHYVFPGPALISAASSGGAVNNAAVGKTTKTATTTKKPKTTAAEATITPAATQSADPSLATDSTDPSTATDSADPSTATDCADDGSDQADGGSDNTNDPTTNGPTTDNAGAEGGSNPDVVTVTVTVTETVHRSTVTATATATVTDSVNLNRKRMMKVHARKNHF